MFAVPLIFLLASCGGSKGSKESKGSRKNNPSALLGVSKSPVYLWVGSTDIPGNITKAAAHARCASEAPSALNGLTHKALLASAQEHPRTLVDGNRPVYRADKTTLIIGRYRDFFHPGVESKVVSDGPVKYYWTGLKTNGNSGLSCNNWRSNAAGDFGHIGVSNVTNYTRFSEEGSQACNSPQTKLLCLSFGD